MKKKSLSKSIPLLSTQLMETYSATFDTSFFEQHPIAWNAKTERFIIYRATSCKLYWFNVVFVLMIINGGFTVIILTKEVISDLNSAWIRICFPLLGCVMGALFSFVLNISYNALEATNLVDNLIRLERRILHGELLTNFVIWMYNYAVTSEDVTELYFSINVRLVIRYKGKHAAL